MENGHKRTMSLEMQRLRQPQLSRLLRKLMEEPLAGRTSAQTRALAGAMLEDAVRENASDIHLDPVQGGYQLRLRIDGALVDTVLLQPEQGLHVLRAFKTHAGLDPASSLKPQDGRAEFRVGNRVVVIRVATAPTVLGEKLALRLLPTELARLALDQPGSSPKNYEQLSRAMHDARGMILVSGPTGAGKTTTLYALLNELKDTNRSLVTIEDPVEYVVEGITQIQVNEKQGLTFAEAVKGLLRLDPDLIMMGEMRDAVSARAALDAADSGHVFLSTLHARDVAGTITALRNFGLADHEIGATVDLIVAQRLVRRLCPACRRHLSQRRWFQLWSDDALVHPDRSRRRNRSPAAPATHVRQAGAGIDRRQRRAASEWGDRRGAGLPAGATAHGPHGVRRCRRGADPVRTCRERDLQAAGHPHDGQLLAAVATQFSLNALRQMGIPLRL
jgi:type II secretory ATPase GspE/PulE/Tfp pilus assembly ATPase PilB-like protein